jgi:16S rRNA (guanine527-N7)-methyltransferase
LKHKHASPDDAADRRRALVLVPVSRETEARLATYAELLRRWQTIKNLVGPSTLPEIWTRHFADSAQVLALAPEALTWADMGSGAGFPGLVLAIMLAETAGAGVHLVDSNARKCAFLREVARSCGAPAVVHNGRAEDVLPTLNPVDVVTARALAPLPRLIEMGQDQFGRGATGIFLKSLGETADDELPGAVWETRMVQSRTSLDGRIVVLRRRPEAPAAPAGDRDGHEG